MGLIKRSPKDAAEGLIKGLSKRMRPKPEPLPDFRFRTLPYRGEGRVKKLPYELPERPNPNARIPANELRPEFRLTGGTMPERSPYKPKGTDDLKYKQPDWLTKILDKGTGMSETAKGSFRSKVKELIKAAKKAGSMKSKPGLTTGRRNQDSQLNKID